MTTTNTSVTDTPNGQAVNGQIPNGGAETKVNLVTDNEKVFNDTIKCSINFHEADEEKKQSLAQIKLKVEDFNEVGIENPHTLFIGPKLAHKVKNDDGTFKVIENVPNPQHLPVEQLEVRGDGCTATPAEAIAIRSAYFEMIDPSGKMKEIFWTPQDKRKAHFTSMERGMFNEFNKQRDKKLATIYNALKPSDTKPPKTNAEKSMDHLTKLIKSLDNFDTDTTDFKKELENFKKHLRNLK